MTAIPGGVDGAPSGHRRDAESAQRVQRHRQLRRVDLRPILGGVENRLIRSMLVNSRPVHLIF